MQGGDDGVIVDADVDVATLVHHCCCQYEMSERRLKVRDLEEQGPDWGFEVRGGERRGLGDEVLEIIGVALGDRK